MKLLITGCNGQLGRKMVCLGSQHELFTRDRDALDITDSNAVTRAVHCMRPDVVINAAAYTAVDKAENDQDAAFAVNRDGPENLAKACEKAGIPLIHVSTDYVFDGCKRGPYVEDDPVAPLGVYGASKWAGEEAVRNYCSKHVILRTSWVFSAHGNNFVKTMLRLGAEREELGIVADQHGCPTFAGELARGIYAVLEYDDVWGTYHFCQPEPTTWHGFAEVIFAEAMRQGMHLHTGQVNPITTKEYPTPAKRPANSVMDCTKFRNVFGISITDWHKSLAEVIKELNLIRDRKLFQTRESTADN